MRIAFWGNFGTDNFGNECTLHAMLSAARRHLPAADLLVICNNPGDTVTRHEVKAVPIAPALPSDPPPSGRTRRRLRRLALELRDWARAAATLRATDMLIVTGTGILTDKSESTFGMPYQMFKWACAARLNRSALHFVSVGAEELKHPLQLFFMSRALRLARSRSYRDAASRERGARLVGGNVADPIYPDLAFSLPAPLLTASRDALAGRRTVAVGIYAVESGTAAMAAYVDVLGTFVLQLLERGRLVRIVIGDAAYDHVAREQLRAWLAQRGALELVSDEPASSFQELVAQLAEADCVVATRFHNLVLALLLGKPVISISHMDKNDELMAAAGLSEYCLQLESLQAAELLERFGRMERNAEPLRRAIQERNEFCRERLEEQYAILFRASGPCADGS